MYLQHKSQGQYENYEHLSLLLYRCCKKLHNDNYTYFCNNMMYAIQLVWFQKHGTYIYHKLYHKCLNRRISRKLFYSSIPRCQRHFYTTYHSIFKHLDLSKSIWHYTKKLQYYGVRGRPMIGVHFLKRVLEHLNTCIWLTKYITLLLIYFKVEFHKDNFIIIKLIKQFYTWHVMTI